MTLRRRPALGWASEYFSTFATKNVTMRGVLLSCDERVPVIGTGNRDIGPMDNEDAEKVTATISSALKSGRCGDQALCRDNRIARTSSVWAWTSKLGNTISPRLTWDGQYHLAEYMAYFRISADVFARFRDDPAAATGFIEASRNSGTGIA